jgi:hypothetical protein
LQDFAEDNDDCVATALEQVDGSPERVGRSIRFHRSFDLQVNDSLISLEAQKKILALSNLANIFTNLQNLKLWFFKLKVIKDLKI